MANEPPVEGLEMTLFKDTYRGRRVLITGHTGFKGSWLAFWLQELGASVTGVALHPATSPNHWDLLDIGIADHRFDIRESTSLVRLFADSRPEIVFHLAAQSLVRRSYQNPLETWSTNVMGTANLLEACRQTDGIRAVVIVTTDKVYENKEWKWGYREIDPLGGHDPYSASKAATELLVSSFRNAFFHAANAPLLASARAGNVIGGGDWAEDRLIADVVRAITNHSPLGVRSPLATRPWQHVLECLSGYLLLGQFLLDGRREYADAWNFGPGPDDNRTVNEVLNIFKTHWPKLTWHAAAGPQSRETNLLYLDSAKARASLGWRPVWTLQEAVT
ncbi:MAG TPA: CDP-glucose 4,6-dehydratase, partial [Thermodesulfovibrionales bacterium]|nr:CDP-glucose 4,6-dehydratase [Thermodesulfovibrionales bacterium]